MMYLLVPFLKADFCSRNTEQSKAGLSGGEVNARYLEKTLGWASRRGVHLLLPAYFFIIFFCVAKDNGQDQCGS